MIIRCVINVKIATNWVLVPYQISNLSYFLRKGGLSQCRVVLGAVNIVKERHIEGTVTK